MKWQEFSSSSISTKTYTHENNTHFDRLLRKCLPCGRICRRDSRSLADKANPFIPCLSKHYCWYRFADRQFSKQSGDLYSKCIATGHGTGPREVYGKRYTG